MDREDERVSLRDLDGRSQHGAAKCVHRCERWLLGREIHAPLLVEHPIEHHVLRQVLALLDLVGLFAQQLSGTVDPMDEDAAELIGDADVVLEDAEARIDEVG